MLSPMNIPLTKTYETSTDDNWIRVAKLTYHRPHDRLHFTFESQRYALQYLVSRQTWEHDGDGRTRNGANHSHRAHCIEVVSAHQRHGQNVFGYGNNREIRIRYADAAHVMGQTTHRLLPGVI